MSDPSNPLRLEAVGVLRNSRRRYDPASKRRLAEVCLQPGVSQAGVVLRHGVNANLLRKRAAGQQRQQRNGVAVGATEVFQLVELGGGQRSRNAGEADFCRALFAHGRGLTMLPGGTPGAGRPDGVASTGQAPCVLSSLSTLRVALADGCELRVQEPSPAKGTPAHAADTRLDHIPPACLKPLPE